MAYSLIGNDPINRASNTTQSRTVIDLVNPCPFSGILREISIYVGATGAFKLKIFRDDGTNFVFVAELSLNAAGTGLNTFPCKIPVLKGDFIGLYDATLSFLDANTAAGSAYDKTGDVTTTTAKATWTPQTWTISEQGKVFKRRGIIL